MSRRGTRLNALYYSENLPDSDTEIGYDSERESTRNQMCESPRFAEWYNYLAQRAYKDQEHEKFKALYCGPDRLQNINKMCGWSVRITSDAVWFVYKPKINNIRLAGYRYHLKFEYMRILQKWYLSRGKSFLPDAINIGRKFHNGIDNPFDIRVNSFLNNVRKTINFYMAKVQYVNRFMETIEKNYRDLEVQFDKRLEQVTFEFKANKEGVWIPSQEITLPNDTIKIEIFLDNHFFATDDGIGYVYKFQKGLDLAAQRRLKNNLDNKLDVFRRQHLMEAFREFMLEN